MLVDDETRAASLQRFVALAGIEPIVSPMTVAARCRTCARTVLTDVNMPFLNGRDLLAQVKQDSRKCQSWS
jgi:CheY-like chemotaxis protein